MAASWRLNEEIEAADARITQASETLGRYFPLANALELLRAAKHRNPLQQQLWQHQAFATILEDIAANVEAHQEAISANADLPEELPGRNALLRAGHTSVKTVKTLSQEELVALDGIGKKRATEINAFLAPKPNVKAEPAKVVPPPVPSPVPAQPQETALAPSPSPASQPEGKVVAVQTLDGAK